MIGYILGWIIAGLIVGALARFIVPGRQNMSILLTIILGIIGAMVGGFIASLLWGPNLIATPDGTYAVETAWPGWIMAVLGGVLVLWLVLAVAGTTRDRVP